MQLALAAAGKLFSSVGLSGAATGAATGAAATATSGFSAATAFSTALQVLGGLGAGLAAKNQAEDMARQTELQSGQEQNAAVQRQTQMKRQLMQVLGENDVTFASAGIDISGGGIAQSSAAAAKKRAGDEISIDRSDTDFKRAMLRMRASGQRAQGRSAMGGALLGALGTVASAGLTAGRIGGAGSSDPWMGLRTVG